jgi:DNA-binding transcriptional ArsR family regulator
MKEFMNAAKAMSDETRIRILLALKTRELCACQITELFGLAQSTMSKHLFLLKQAGLVDARKNGRWIYYSLPGKEAPAFIREALAWAQKSLARNPRTIEDAGKVKKILCIDPTLICQKQTRK